MERASAGFGNALQSADPGSSSGLYTQSMMAMEATGSHDAPSSEVAFTKKVGFNKLAFKKQFFAQPSSLNHVTATAAGYDGSRALHAANEFVNDSYTLVVS